MIRKKTTPIAQEDTQKQEEQTPILPHINVPRSYTPYYVLLLIVFSFLLGSLTTKISYLEKDKQDTAKTAQANQQPQVVPTEDSSPKKVSLDNAPLLGDKNAQVTLVEFSDYECPFCKRYFEDTYSQIKKDYIDTGKVKLVFKNLPLSFHQNAHKEAEAALCIKEQGGDDAYFKFHDEMFKRTTSNGTGLTLDELPVIANDLGFNSDALQACLDGNKYKDAVDKDLTQATQVDATGTPTFFVGKSNPKGSIMGTKLVGAQPYTAFKTIIDQELAKK